MKAPGPSTNPEFQGRITANTLVLAAAVALSLVSVGMLMASAGRVAVLVVLVVGVGVSFGAVMGAAHIGHPRIALLLQGAGGAVMARNLAVPGADPSWLLGWMVGLVATLVLVSHIGTKGSRVLPGSAASAPRRGSVRAFVLVTVFVLIVMVLFGPSLADRLGSDSARRGDSPSGSATSPPLLARDSLDVTVRPKLSNEVVMTVRSPVPSFWRGEIFDVWDGTTWTRSDPDPPEPIFTPTLGRGAYDLGGGAPDSFEQTFQLVASASNIIFAAPVPVTVEAPGLVSQRADGTMVTDGMGAGARYTVNSRRFPVTRTDLLDAKGPTPADLSRQYAEHPVATDRTVAAAQRVTRSAPSTIEKVEALEAWMGRNTEYSINAPVAPRGVDVVDDFLFESRQGWCEQIASSLVVLLRSVGVPARLVTGYVPGSRSAFSDTYRVRASDAHAWSEVWFPGVGWQAFDPTADVPLAGDADKRTGFSWLRNHALLLAVSGLLAVGVALALRLARERWLDRPSRRGWAAATLGRMERLGHDAGRPRRPHETATAYGGTLATVLDAAALADVGRSVDDDRYRPAPLPAPDRSRSDTILADLEAR